MATKYYASTINGAYLGGFSEELTPPANSVEVPNPPDFAIQVWTGSAWVPNLEPQPLPQTLLTLIAYDIVQNGFPWQMLQFFYPLQMQGTAQNAEIDFLRKTLWSILKNDPANTWLTQDAIDKMEAWGEQCNMPFV